MSWVWLKVYEVELIKGRVVYYLLLRQWKKMSLQLLKSWQLTVRTRWPGLIGVPFARSCLPNFQCIQQKKQSVLLISYALPACISVSAGGAGAAVGSLQQQIHTWHTVPHSHASHLCGEQLQQLGLCWTGDLGESLWCWLWWWCRRHSTCIWMLHTAVWGWLKAEEEDSSSSQMPAKWVL